ncbi:GNAT family acetyltransferase [Natrialba magadii ATCC 43099]|uniref:GNAT family acetyltransferase n=1 Tax=Natrialba magadii (strain ATCC 43099 / DSM 3394 / CCM 3739 / CIP 104546 / IAM 13178 / JCM 8861 / NBRC 102185 / NCIMB 2190 / MS3) TaxID=547559 RepID=D3SSN1_NATMM|nr:GNAT family N-acetyltransferase [Natrialba magadii]ADD06876.1 GNAT family acetyltransferase [Natrialba magadii ATCC 43099]ELY28398.1 N-acetyltransferase GCN5 [Natrialba magadii ATCC 43099]
MAPELTIEHATTDDIDAVTDLWVQLAQGQREHDSAVRAEANREAMRETLAAHQITDGLLVARVGEDDNTHDIVGFASVSLERGSLELDRTRGLLSNLYVLPAYRGQGIGSKLLVAAATELEDQGAEVLLLEVMAANDAARRFYRSHGFEPYRLGMQRPLTDVSDED